MGRANAAQLSRLEALQVKQQEVLRRKMEEAAVARRRLKELEDTKKGRRAYKDNLAAKLNGVAGPSDILSRNDSARATESEETAGEEGNASFLPPTVLEDEGARREWIEKELDACCTSHDLAKVLEGEKALRTEAARQLREVERRIAALKNPQWWPGMQNKGVITQEALDRKKQRLESALDMHSNSIQDLQLQLVKARAEEEERGAGAADIKRWAGIPGGQAAQAMAVTVFRAATQHKAACYEAQLQLTEVTEEVEMLRLRLEVAMQEKMEAERVAAEAQAALAMTPQTTPASSVISRATTDQSMGSASMGKNSQSNTNVNGLSRKTSLTPTSALNQGGRKLSVERTGSGGQESGVGGLTRRPSSGASPGKRSPPQNRQPPVTVPARRKAELSQDKESVGKKEEAKEPVTQDVGFDSSIYFYQGSTHWLYCILQFHYYKNQKPTQGTFFSYDQCRLLSHLLLSFSPSWSSLPIPLTWNSVKSLNLQWLILNSPWTPPRPYLHLVLVMHQVLPLMVMAPLPLRTTPC